MPTAANPDNYTLGRGIVYFDKLMDSDLNQYDGERDLGNASAFAVSNATDNLPHYNTRSGLKSKDKIVVIEITPTITFTLDEINVENVAMVFFADVSQDVQAAQDDLNTILAYGYIGNRYYDLGQYRNIGIWYLDYDGGTGSAAVIGEVVSGATGEGTVIGWTSASDATSGTLFIDTITAGFVDNEAITGDAAFVATADGTETWDITRLCVVDTATGLVMYDLTDDYTVDSATGRIYIVSGGAIETTAASITVYFGVAASTTTVINAFEETSIEGRVRFVPDNPVGNNMELLFWRVDLTPAGEMGMIADDWQVLEFTGEVLKDETYHASEPYGRIVTDDTV